MPPNRQINNSESEELKIERISNGFQKYMEMQQYLNLKDETKIDNKNIRKKDIERSDYEQIEPIEGTSKSPILHIWIIKLRKLFQMLRKIINCLTNIWKSIN